MILARTGNSKVVTKVDKLTQLIKLMLIIIHFSGFLPLMPLFLSLPSKTGTLMPDICSYPSFHALFFSALTPSACNFSLKDPPRGL